MIVLFHVGVHVWTDVFEYERKLLWCVANVVQGDNIIMSQETKEANLTKRGAWSTLVVLLEDLFQGNQVVAEPRAAHVDGGVSALAEPLKSSVRFNLAIA